MSNIGIKIFAGSTGQSFAEKITDYIGIEQGKSEVIKFPEGNTMVKVGENVRDKDVYLVQSIGLNPNDEFVEIMFWMDTFKRASANSITAIIPYFGYAMGNKKDQPRMPIRAKVCAEAIETAGADRVVTMDLHRAQVQGFFKKPMDHLFALPVLCKYIKQLSLDDLVVVSSDIGFIKQARKYASFLNVPVAIADKTRQVHNGKPEILDVIGNVKDKNVLIVDDFSICGSTLVSVAKALREEGAKKIISSISHILLNKEAVKKIEASPIELLISTDSVDNKAVLNSDQIKIVSIAPLFAEAINRIHSKKSVSTLYTDVPDKVFYSSFYKEISFK